MSHTNQPTITTRHFFHQCVDSKMSYLATMALLLACSVSTQLSEALASQVAIVTGANGYVGREVVRVLLEEPGSSSIFCLVRPGRVDTERDYWKSVESISVLPFEMNDGGLTIQSAIDQAKSQGENICVYHVASVFGPTEDPIQTARDNVQGTEDLVRVLAKNGKCRLVLTSSMAAVRGTGQDPLNGQFYTQDDWNTISKLNADSWGSCYQWSKAESERRAWELSESLGVPMASICPSFVFGPSTDATSKSFSITLVNQWIKGESPVQSRLCVDIRDVARAHVAAGTRPHAIGKRFLVTTERRISSERIADVLKKTCRECNAGNPERIHHDSVFQGGAIPIGQKEVDSAEHLQEYLGVELRPVEET